MLRPGHILQLSAMALLGLAVVMVHSAGMTMGGDSFDAWSIVSSWPACFAAVAVAAMWLSAKLVDLRLLMSERTLLGLSPITWLMGASLLLLAGPYVPGVGVEINGAHRWIRMPGGLTFQPSEVVKWSLILGLACWCAGRERDMAHWGRGPLAPLLLVAAACGVIAMEDFGTAALIFVVCAGLLIAGGAPMWQLATASPFVAAGAYAYIVTSPYRVDRVMSFLDPWRDPLGKGYQSIQSMLAIAGGGPTGQGLGNGVQKFEYLPADTTDFVFSIICEEMGLAGAAAVIGLYMLILWSGMTIVSRCRDTFARLFVLGVMLTLGLQALINLLVVTALVPNKGIALPLVSSGGTGWILTGLALGLVASLDEDVEPRATATEAEGEGLESDEDSSPQPFEAIPTGG